MSALGPGEIRARSRPLVVLLIAALRACSAAIVVSPLSALVASTAIGQRPEGDRALFDDGAYFLLEVLRLRGGELESTLRGLVPLIVVALFLNVTLNAALFTALNFRPLPLARLLRAALRSTPSFAVLGLGATLLQGILVLLGSSAIAAIPEPLHRPVPTTLAELGAVLLLGLSAGALGGAADVAKAALVRHESSLREAVRHALSCLRKSPLAAAFGWVPWAAAFGLLAFAADQLCASIDVSRPGGWRVWAVFTAHQLVIIGAVLTRAAWYARALRLVATSG